MLEGNFFDGEAKGKKSSYCLCNYPGIQGLRTISRGKFSVTYNRGLKEGSQNLKNKAVLLFSSFCPILPMCLFFWGGLPDESF